MLLSHQFSVVVSILFLYLEVQFIKVPFRAVIRNFKQMLKVLLRV